MRVRDTSKTWNAFKSFIKKLVQGKFVLDEREVYKIALTNRIPSANSVNSDIVEIPQGNGYIAGGKDIQCSFLRVGNRVLLCGKTICWKATGGRIGPFRYLLLYNITRSGNNIIAWYDCRYAWPNERDKA